jgi:hypothetical protein
VLWKNCHTAWTNCMNGAPCLETLLFCQPHFFFEEFHAPVATLFIGQEAAIGVLRRSLELDRVI